MEASEFVQTIETLHRDARARGLFFQDTTDAAYRGRTVHIDGREKLSFGSCSYLGLELHPALIEGACDAARRYGTQFSTSRGYLSAPLYAELEGLFDQLFGGHTLLAPTTTLAHLSAFDVLANERDAVVLDHQVHQSVQQAVNLARTRGTKVSVVRHEELERALDVVAALARQHETVWFATDGVNSMYGDLAPFALLRQLLDVAPNVRLYVDDAHGMSWAGRHGRGSFLAGIPLSERVVVATSLAKAFGAGGGVLVFHSAAERDRVRMCGGPLLFSGPIQPPMLGAIVASAKVHLTDEIVGLQQQLQDRVALANQLIRDTALPQLVENQTPLRFIRLGLPRVANHVAQRLLDDGIYVNVSMYPTVPMRRAGIRLSINANHTPDEVARVVHALAEHVPAVLAEHDLSRAEIDALFARAVVSGLGEGAPTAGVAPASTAANESGRVPRRPRVTGGADALRVEHRRTIRDVDRGEWDRLLGHTATCSWHSLAALEDLHRDRPEREHDWVFDYVLARDGQGRPVAATHLTTSLQKDDFLMREEVSAAVEVRRRDDPYFLTSRVVMTGSAFSEGDHLYLDREGPWQRAMSAVLALTHKVYERENADAVMLRDLRDGDPAMDAFLLEQGYLKAPMLDSHYLDLDAGGEAGLLARVGPNRRRHLRKMARHAEYYTRAVYGAGLAGPALSDEGAAVLHALYRNVAGRKLRINVFAMPEQTVGALLRSPSWEIVTLTVKPERGGPPSGRPVAWYAAHKHDGHYAPFCCGLDYRFVHRENSAYQQLLFQVVRRAIELEMKQVHFGMDADVEKLRLGTRTAKNCVYLQVRDHFNGVVLRDLVANVGAEVDAHGADPGVSTDRIRVAPGVASERLKVG